MGPADHENGRMAAGATDRTLRIGGRDYDPAGTSDSLFLVVDSIRTNWEINPLRYLLSSAALFRRDHAFVRALRLSL